MTHYGMPAQICLGQETISDLRDVTKMAWFIKTENYTHINHDDTVGLPSSMPMYLFKALAVMRMAQLNKRQIEKAIDTAGDLRLGGKIMYFSSRGKWCKLPVSEFDAVIVTMYNQMNEEERKQATKTALLHCFESTGCYALTDKLGIER